MVDLSSFSSVPDFSSMAYRKEDWDGYKVFYYQDPLNFGIESFSKIHYGISVFKGDVLMYAATISSIDLRDMSKELGIKLDTLRRDYGVKGFLTDPVVTLFKDSDEINLGPYKGSMERESAFSFLFETVADYMDEEE